MQPCALVFVGEQHWTLRSLIHKFKKHSQNDRTIRLI